MLGLYREERDDSYTGTSTAPGSGISLSTLSGGGYTAWSALNNLNDASDRPDAVAPHSMSEFYSYDNDTGNSTTEGLILDDWADGTLGTSSTRDNFSQTAFAGLPGTSVLNVNDTSWRDRPDWTPSPDGPNLDPSAGFRLHNTNSPYGQWMKLLGPNQGLPSTGIAIDGGGTGTHAFYLRYHFYMNSTNNKDHILDIRMNTTNHPNPGLSTYTYQLQIHDNNDPATGKLTFKRRNGTSVTTLGTSTSGAYTIGTTKAIFLNYGYGVGPKFPDNTWKIAVGPTTTPNASLANSPSYIKITATDSTYTTLYGLNFRCPKAMSTPTSTHHHKVDLCYLNKYQEA
jgi:hypothetical protein